jgi:hypothetical protein
MGEVVGVLFSPCLSGFCVCVIMVLFDLMGLEKGDGSMGGMAFAFSFSFRV